MNEWCWFRLRKATEFGVSLVLCAVALIICVTVAVYVAPYNLVIRNITAELVQQNGNW